MPIIQSSALHLIQHLGVVVLNNYEALAGGPDWPGDDFVYDPSTPGDPSTWGRRVIGTDPDTGDPITPQDLGTRVPGGGAGGPAKRRKGGTGMPPNKNTLTRVDASGGSRACFAGFVRVRITKPAPDPFHWTGQTPTFITDPGSCKPYNPPAIPKPATALSLGSPNLITVVGIYLTANVGSDSYAEVIDDELGGPGASCTTDATCPAFSVASYAGTGNGTIIRPA